MGDVVVCLSLSGIWRNDKPERQYENKDIKEKNPKSNDNKSSFRMIKIIWHIDNPKIGQCVQQIFFFAKG